MDELLTLNEWLDALGIDRAYRKDMKDTYQKDIPALEAQLAKALKLDITMSGVERLGHFGVVRDWTINLKDGREISLDAEIIKEIVEHENSEHRLDSPDREKLQDTYGVIRYGADAYERYRSGRGMPDDWNLFQYELDQILALYPDEEEIRKQVETLFADTPTFTTFIRTRDNKAGVEECYLIMKSEWLKGGK